MPHDIETPLRLGSLCTGYGGLDLATAQVLNTQTMWVADVCKTNDDGTVGHHIPHRAPCTILGHRFPGVPNLGDISKVDWTRVPPIDVLTGGTPCQDLSHAGKRAGMTAGTRSNLWVTMREAIATLRPRLVVWENVRGALSAQADSELESNPRLLGSVRRRDGEPVLRALGRVLGDLADLRYDARWCGVRASDVGAPHNRFRIFLVAYPADAPHLGHQRGRAPRGRGAGPTDDDRGPLLPTPTTQDAANVAGDSQQRRNTRPLNAVVRAHAGLLPTPRATDGTKGGPNQHGSSGDLMLPAAVHLLPTPVAVEGWGLTPDGEKYGPTSGTTLHDVARQLLPTPVVNDMGEGKTPEAWDQWTTRMKADHDNGNGHGPSLAIEAQRSTNRWGDYAEAITRWETLTRPAPPPTEPSPKGGQRLSPRFVEWLMGLPDGWVTNTPGITRNEALRALGNGVLPAQGAAALTHLLDL